LDGLTYDLEPLSPGAGQRKAEAGWSGPTSISGKSLKAFFAFGDFSEMTSRDKEADAAPMNEYGSFTQ
jgi:hypothetical protein